MIAPREKKYLLPKGRSLREDFFVSLREMRIIFPKGMIKKLPKGEEQIFPKGKSIFSLREAWLWLPL